MVTQTNDKAWAKQTGFTIVELLIVIVVIGILATIAIVAYNGVQGQAHDSTIKSNLSNFSKQIELYATMENGGLYPVGTTALANVNIKPSRDSYDTSRANLYYCATITGDQYAMTAISKSGKVFRLLNGTVSETTTGQAWQSSTCNAMDPDTANTSGTNGYTGTTWNSWVK